MTFKNSRYHLTHQAFLNYSLRMKAEFDSLEHKLAQLVQLSQRLRVENHELRQALAESRNDQRLCSDKIDQAKARLEKLLEQLPEDA
jgi:cell division protein ZapB